MRSADEPTDSFGKIPPRPAPGPAPDPKAQQVSEFEKKPHELYRDYIKREDNCDD